MRRGLLGRRTGNIAVPAAMALVLVLVAPPAPARGVLLESPREDSGMPLFPQQAGAFYAASYGVGGNRVEVYYSDRELNVPALSDSESCGGYTLGHIDDPDFAVRYVGIEDEHVFFLWEEAMSESGREVDICAYIPSFAERYSFFARNFRGDLRSRLPGIIGTK